MILNKIRNARRPSSVYTEGMIGIMEKNNRLDKQTHCCKVERGIHYLTVVPAKEDSGQFEVS